jgi:hypothetical protein
LKRCVSLLLSMSLLVPRPALADAVHQCVQAAHEGQRLRDEGKLSSARNEFVQCSATSCPDPVRESCERWVAELDPRLPSIVLSAHDERGTDLSDVRVSLDGKELTRSLDGRAVTVDPGRHELLFEAEGFVPVRQFFIAREGEKLRAVTTAMGRPVREEPSPAAVATAPRPIAPMVVAGGAGVLGFTGFAVFGLWGKSERDRMADTCAAAQTCSDGDVSSAQTKYLVADISLAVGIIGVGVLAAYLIAPLVTRR